ncbi:GGDEF and EAL domain-containing protein [Sporosarcina saromensis]|uniref:GGDEF and EAL domain-containing protein n=1 Tax=Sporosarcina saromensis TaxID=359365 RepID=A0ABU4G6E7_9BACL|nr:GGDEF and EAL domain-containing protein [Sporosarcina saromensis]MDW0112549.1 GGDEF and EAL domain-containing protein [Sporosarcina saromensis]
MQHSLEEIEKILEQMMEKQEYIFTHAQQLNVSRESIADMLLEICIRIARIIDCEKVSIWLFNEDHSMLNAQTIYEHPNTQVPLTNLYRHSAPSYFKAIEQERIIAVSNVMTDSRTCELKEDSQYRNGPIQSIVDASILLSKGIGGVLCCESIHQREWTVFEKVLVTSIADMLSFLFDRLERIEVEEHVHHLAYKDLVTGLDNQYAFNEKVTEKLRTLATHERGLFMYFVLDQFTEVQGVLGHDGADQMLKITAERLKELFPEPAQTARIAFDHFILFSPFEGELSDKRKMLDHITNKLKHPMYICGQEVYMTFSYGAAIYPDHAKDVKHGIQAAYMALQAGRKTSNRKSGSVYNPNMHTYLKETMLSEMNLRRGLDLNEFQLHYQPQVNCRTGEVIGFEALLRWQHPERGLIFPSDFIELAESTGLITPIGEWVIREAVKQISEWNKMGIENVTVSINLSPRHFLHHNLPFFLEQCIQEARIKPQRLVLEITENVAMEEQSAVTSRIKLLKEMGYSVSIDDFGKGYSAFIYLKHFPINEIKIDREFISELGSNMQSIGIVQTIIHLAEMLGLRTIGEGVETKEQWDILKQLGCSQLQGYYFSKPIEVNQINELFHKYGRGGKLLLPSASKVLL